MKHKLLKDLPLAKAGTEVTLIYDGIHYEIITDESLDCVCIWYILPKDVQEWFTEVKEEPLSIYDLKEGDEYWFLTTKWVILKDEKEDYCTLSPMCDFPTEREAKRHKLLRELATREKWLPKVWEFFYFEWKRIMWKLNQERSVEYHLWFVFRDEQEYNKYMTEEARNLLFNL